jgi:glycosyltransferase involved in cell wall biosynthesis
VTVRISTIIPTFNNEGTIARAIDSALAQDCLDHEVIVVNDGSTDHTRAVLERYRSKTRIVEQTNRGAAMARNAGVAQAGGEYLAFLDADDEWESGRLTRMQGALEKNSEAALSFCGFRRRLASGLELDACIFDARPSMAEMMRERSRIVPSAVVMRRRAFERIGGFSERFDRNYFEDSFMWILAREQGAFELIREPLTTCHVENRGVPDRYFSNGQLFIKLVRERYGRSASSLIKETYLDLSSVALQQASRFLDGGQVEAFLRAMGRAARFRPGLLANPRTLSRLARAENIKRLVRLLSCARLHKRAAAADRIR